MRYIKKRDGRIVEFNRNKIVNAILKAFEQVDGEVNDYAIEKANNIANFIAKEQKHMLDVEEVQDLVENGLMSTRRKDVARAYIRYRQERERIRKWNTVVIISNKTRPPCNIYYFEANTETEMFKTIYITGWFMFLFKYEKIFPLHPEGHPYNESY